MDPARDDDEAGTDGDDEAEIVDNQIVRNNKKASGVATAATTTPGGTSANADMGENWVEVKSKKSDRKSLPKDSASFDCNKKDDRREELEFQFDEDLDMPVATGRQNKFSSM